MYVDTFYWKGREILSTNHGRSHKLLLCLQTLHLLNLASACLAKDKRTPHRFHRHIQLRKDNRLMPQRQEESRGSLPRRISSLTTCSLFVTHVQVNQLCLCTLYRALHLCARFIQPHTCSAEQISLCGTGNGSASRASGRGARSY